MFHYSARAPTEQTEAKRISTEVDAEQSLTRRSCLRTLMLGLCVATFPAVASGCGVAGPVTRLEVDATGSAVAWRTALLRNLGVVVDVVARERGRLVAAAIDQDSLAHDVLVADVDFAVDDGGNQLVRQRLIAACRRQVTDAIGARLASSPASGGSDCFGALAAGGQYLLQYPMSQRTRLVFLSDMVNTAGGPGRNLTAGEWGDPSVQQHLIGALRREGLLPDLHRVQVWVAGAGLTSGEGLSGQQLQRVRQLWLAVFKAAGAGDIQYATNLVDPSRS
jgi:hypothetical protein